MMKQLLTTTLFFAFGATVALAQTNRDQGTFIESENAFYNQIQSDLDKYQQGTTAPRRVFKANTNGYKLPASLDEFNTVWCNSPISQGRTGTCWCFSTSSFFESEVYRISKKEVKLSELYTVYFEYVEKAREYVRTRGGSYFGEGSETNAVARMMDQYGVVPLSAYNGLKDGQPFHDHERMFDEMTTYLTVCKTTQYWDEAAILSNIKSILNFHLGVPPTEVTVEGKKMTPHQYLTEYLGVKPDEYVNFMSLMQEPYWSKAVYDVPDNWWKSDAYYNVPLNDFTGALKQSLKNGFSIALGGDVSEPGYLSDQDAAIVPTFDIPSEYIDESARQFRFSNGSTTDDHAIHIVGYTENESGTWFLIKDSGSGARNGKFPGYYFYHEDYVKLKMMSFTVHKDAVKGLLKEVN